MKVTTWIVSIVKCCGKRIQVRILLEFFRYHGNEITLRYIVDNCLLKFISWDKHVIDLYELNRPFKCYM